MVKAKFRCSSVTEFESNKQATLSPVIGKKGENAEFSKYTPNGHLEITIDKETKAADFFAPGKEYYLTFEESLTIDEA